DDAHATVADLLCDLTGHEDLVALELDVELDREMIEMIRDPITHLIRNAIDHGIEKPADRRAAGKREIGMLSIASRQSGNTITIIITDDGAGLNVQKVGAKAVRSGIVTQDELDAMSAAQITDLIFEPGLSTAEAVSAVSGRGVGMDVVRSNIEKVGGKVSVSSKPGEGTRFTLELPLTLSIISALTVSIGDQFFAIPHSYVIPCLTLNTVLHVDPRRAGPDQRLVLLRLGNGMVFALAVDQIHDQEDLVIKPLSPAIMACGIYAGTTLLDDGRAVLMLDIPAIAEENGLVRDIRSRNRAEDSEDREELQRPSRTLMTFTDFDGRKRALPLELVARLDLVPSSAFDCEENRANVVIDGTIFDVAVTLPADLPTGQVKVLRLSDSVAEIA
ncbi:MAG: chemotaxis protein CheA, partial [Erythrobacter sp. 34-65-8]